MSRPATKQDKRPRRCSTDRISFIGVSPIISKQVGLVNWASLRSILCVLKVVRVIWFGKRSSGYQPRRWTGDRHSYNMDCFIVRTPWACSGTRFAYASSNGLILGGGGGGGCLIKSYRKITARLFFVYIHYERK